MGDKKESRVNDLDWMNILVSAIVGAIVSAVINPFISPAVEKIKKNYISKFL